MPILTIIYIGFWFTMGCLGTLLVVDIIKNVITMVLDSASKRHFRKRVQDIEDQVEAREKAHKEKMDDLELPAILQEGMKSGSVKIGM